MPRIQQLFKQLQSAIQTGSEAAIQRFVQQLVNFAFGPEVKWSPELQENLLAKYNIPDAKVSYRRVW